MRGKRKRWAGQRPQERGGVFAPQMHYCQCGKWGAYGVGPPLKDVQAWYCGDCLPDEYRVQYPRARAAP